MIFWIELNGIDKYVIIELAAAAIPQTPSGLTNRLDDNNTCSISDMVASGYKAIDGF